MCGLTSSELEMIIEVFKSHPQIEEAVLFGSRALKRNRKGSDVDIALKGSSLGPLVAQVSGILNDEVPLPYFFDILDYEQIINDDLKDHIDRIGKTIYMK